MSTKKRKKKISLREVKIGFSQISCSALRSNRTQSLTRTKFRSKVGTFLIMNNFLCPMTDVDKKKILQANEVKKILE